jgi:hypothetical protein
MKKKIHTYRTSRRNSHHSNTRLDVITRVK